jgi:polysaccharide export outer membrane protein
MSSHDSALVLSLLTIGVLGCGGGSASRPQTVAPVASFESQRVVSTSHVIGVEDVLDVTVFDAPDLSTSTRVAGDGSIALPLVGSVPAAGLTPTQLATHIEGRLRGSYMVNPRVSVGVTEAKIRPIYVLGSVNRPGMYPLDNSTPVTVLRAIALGEGVQGTANKTNAFIIRTLPSGERQEIPVNLKALLDGREPDPALLANDIVYVPADPVKSLARGVADGLIRVVRGGIF